MIDYVGGLSPSKSLMNRALIIRSLNPNLKIDGASESDDVTLMQKALEGLEAGEKSFTCGHAGTVLRFLAFRLSREKGAYDLYGSERLFSRPQDEIQKVLAQLGASCHLTMDSNGRRVLRLESTGWRPQGDGVFISGRQSSQYASGLVLSAWDLIFPLAITFNSPLVSEDYFLMTVRLCQRLGMHIDGDGREWYVPARQRTTIDSYEPEMDLSSAFALAALAAMSGHLSLVHFPLNSLQPDRIFLEYFKQMQIPFELHNETLKISKCANWVGLQADLNRHPDLLPVLSVLCAFAKTESHLKGLDHLAYKESNRVEKSKELLEALGAKVSVDTADGLSLKIVPRAQGEIPNFIFDPDQDHRMAMAAAVANARGAQIEILDKFVVTKSFPEFWQIAGES